MAPRNPERTAPHRRICVLLAFCLAQPLLAEETTWQRFDQLLRSRDYTSAAAHLQVLAQQQDARACYELAQLYRSGKGVNTDPARARELLRVAADQGHRDSQYLLGVFYLKGIGGARNPAQAEHYLRLSEQQGHPKAAETLAQIVATGQEPESTALVILNAAREGKQHVLEEAQAQGSLAAIADEQGNSLLMLALDHDQLSTAQWLLAQGLDINAQNHFGESALHKACKDEELDRVQWLLRQHAQPDLQNRSGKTPLHLAVEKSHPALVEALLKAGAKAGIQDHEGLSALAQARVRQHPTILAALKSHGYPVAEPDTQQQRLQAAQQLTSEVSPLQLAVERSDLALLKSLLPKTASPWQFNAQGQTLITLAAGRSSPAVLAFLLEQSEGQGRVDQRGRTALFEALAQNREDNLKLLLNARVDPLQQDNHGQSALTFALDQGSALSGRLLNAVEPKNWQAEWLPISAAKGLFDVSMRLIQQGLDVNSADKQGRTALYYSAIAGQLKTVEALLKTGRDAALPDNAGNTLLHAVAATEQIEVMQHLLKSSAYIRHINTQNKHGSSPIHIAASAGKSTQVAALIEAGADKDMKDGSGNTALILAVMAQDEETVAALLAAKAAISKRNQNKQNALSVAEQLGYLKIAEQIRKATDERGVLSIFQ